MVGTRRRESLYMSKIKRMTNVVLVLHGHMTSPLDATFEVSLAVRLSGR